MKSLLAAALLAAAVPAAASAQPAPAATIAGTRLDVVATGEVSRVPDLARISAGVVAVAPTASAALAENAGAAWPRCGPRWSRRHRRPRHPDQPGQPLSRNIGRTRTAAAAADHRLSGQQRSHDPLPRHRRDRRDPRRAGRPGRQPDQRPDRSKCQARGSARRGAHQGARRRPRPRRALRPRASARGSAGSSRSARPAPTVRAGRGR